MTKIFLDPIVIVDTETTGFTQRSEVIEIGAVCIDEWGRPRTHFSSLLRPTNLDYRAKKALQVNKIDKTSLLHAPNPAKVANAFCDWLRKIPTQHGEIICTAFNSSFDQRMLATLGIHLRWGTCIRTMTNQVMKAQGKQPRDVNGRARAPSLKEACAFFAIDYPEDAHRALVDAEITAKVAIQAYKEYRAHQSF